MNVKFRGDVELMRGLAVTLVFLFHLKLTFIPSGFIGVDVFFVISGYLMAAAFSSSDATLFDFYERRARRVLPAAMVIMLLFFLISPFIFLPFEARKIAEPFWGMILFLPNLIFWKVDDYFSALVFSPTLHYWSLGVELQYYIVFPVLVYLFGRKSLPYVIIAFVSFIVCILVLKTSSKTAFFLLPFRLWEFLAGFFAFNLSTNKKIRSFADTYSGVAIFTASIMGLIIYSLVPIPQNKFPGFYALIPVLLTFLAIVVGLAEHRLNAVFGIKVIRWIGKVSYSIYLIHFLVIFVFIYSPFSAWKVLNLYESLAVVGITLLLSAFSYSYLELPFRSRALVSTKKFWIGLLGLYFLCALIIVAYGQLGYFSFMRQSEVQRVSNAIDDHGGFRCSKFQKLLEFGESSCYLFKAENSLKKVYLVGDSHVDVIKHEFVREAVKNSISVRLNRDRCLLGSEQCSSSEVIAQIKKYDITDVVLHGYSYDKFDYSNLQDLIDWTSGNRVKLHFIGPVPTYPKSIPELMYKEFIAKSNFIEPIDVETFLREVSLKFVEFKRSNQEKKGVFFYSPENYFCTPVCKYVDARGIYYYDSNHLTLTGTELLVPMVMEIYNKLPIKQEEF